MFSKACEYGIRASVFIAVQSMKGQRVNLQDIVLEIGTPVAFTAKILQTLAKNDIIHSLKGPNGGFIIEQKRLSKIYLSEVVRAIDGDDIYTGCALGLKECSKKFPCPVHDKFKKVRSRLRKMLESTTLYELSLDIKKGNSFLIGGNQADKRVKRS